MLYLGEMLVFDAQAAKSSVTAAICRARSVGGITLHRGWCAIGVGDEGRGKCTNGEGVTAGPRGSVRDS